MGSCVAAFACVHAVLREQQRDDIYVPVARRMCSGVMRPRPRVYVDAEARLQQQAYYICLPIDRGEMEGVRPWS